MPWFQRWEPTSQASLEQAVCGAGDGLSFVGLHTAGPFR
jgi:hypothetical protein